MREAIGLHLDVILPFDRRPVLHVTIDEEGGVLNPRVIRSLGLGLDEKATEAIRKWEFRPAVKNGQAVPFDAQIEIDFRLK